MKSNFSVIFFSETCNCHYINKLILFHKGDSGGPLVCADGSSSSRSKNYLFGVLSGGSGLTEKTLWKIENGKLINKVWSYKKLSIKYFNNTKLLKLSNPSDPKRTPNGPHNETPMEPQTNPKWTPNGPPTPNIP